MKYVVDTCIFNKLIDGALSTEDIPSEAELVATHVQIDELKNTRNAGRRERLLERFSTLIDAVMPTESTVLDVSRFDYAKLSDGSLFNRLKIDLDSLNKAKPNNKQDALIAEFAIANGCTMLTADRDLAAVVKRHGCIVWHFTP